MKLPEIVQVNFNNYTLGASFCRKILEQDIECCTIQLESNKFSNTYVSAIYRASTGDFEQFLNKSDCIINYLYNAKSEFIICGDINMDFLTESHNKQCLISLLTSFNLTSTANFVTRIQNGSSTTTNNVFIDSNR
jgi:hypothetical protein